VPPDAARRIITKHNEIMSEGRPSPTVSTVSEPQAVTRRGIWLVGLTAGVSVLLALGGEAARLALRYEREGVLAGEGWRLLTGHFVHGGPAHLLLNIAGLTLIAGLFPRDYSISQWLIVGCASLAAIDLGFVLFEPQLTWYVGLSGLLHGALAAGAVSWWRHESKLLAGSLSAILIGKLAWEQWHGALPLSGDMNVIVDAHLYGAIGGLLAGIGFCLYLQRWSVRP
jgi:rhomboid family GlyGly-CTERM serine protease